MGFNAELVVLMKNQKFKYDDFSKKGIIIWILVLPCYAGILSIVITETGEVYPCEILSKSFGNLRNNNYNITYGRWLRYKLKSPKWVIRQAYNLGRLMEGQGIIA